MKKYFKFPAESDLGIGIQYIEFDDNNWPIRQVERYGDRLFNSNEGYHKELGCMGLCDQQLTPAGMDLGKAINAEEFESIWKLSSEDLTVDSNTLENNVLNSSILATSQPIHQLTNSHKQLSDSQKDRGQYNWITRYEESNWIARNQRLKELSMQLAVESNPIRKFQLEKQIQEEEKDIKYSRKILNHLE